MAPKTQDRRNQVFDEIDADRNGSVTQFELRNESGPLTRQAQKLLKEELAPSFGSSFNRDQYFEWTNLVYDTFKPEIVTLKGDHKSFVINTEEERRGFETSLVITADSPEQKEQLSQLIQKEYGPWLADRAGYNYGQNQTSTKRNIVAEPAINHMEEFLLEKGITSQKEGKMLITPANGVPYGAAVLNVNPPQP